MPEDNVKEPTEKEEQERFDKCVPKDKHETRKIRFNSPKKLANFLVSHKASYAYLSANRIKKLFPNIWMSVKSINELMQDPIFYKTVNEQIPEVNRQQASGMFDMVLQQYFEGQMQLKRGDVLCPDAKALTILGQISGKYDPAQKMELFDGHKVDAEKQKAINTEVVNALLNKIKREQEKKEGGNGE